MVKEIPLTKGYIALVDDEDYESLKDFNWRVLKNRCGTYAICNAWIEGKRVALLMHRAILKPEKGMVVDHADYDGLNNTRANIRIVTPKQNRTLQRPRITKAYSSYKGVSKDKRVIKNPWLAQINIENKNVFIGLFHTAEEAAKAYDKAALEFYGEFAFLNFPENRLICS